MSYYDAKMSPKGYGDTPHRLWVNEASTILVQMWASGTLEIAFRVSGKDSVWGPPIVMHEQPQPKLP